MRKIPKVVCADGFTVSVQASSGHYCEPRSDSGPWTEFELGYPSEPDELIAQYAESPSRPTDTVYGWVPVAVVEALIAKHGGTDGDWQSFVPHPFEGLLQMMNPCEVREASETMGLEKSLKYLAAIIADTSANRETRRRAAERARWVVGMLPLT